MVSNYGHDAALHTFDKSAGRLGFDVIDLLLRQPLLDVALLQRMLVRHAVTAGSILVTTQCRVDGPPVLFPRDCFETLVHWSGAHGARTLLEREAHRVERFAAPDLVDVDTPEDLQRVRESLVTHHAQQ